MEERRKISTEGKIGIFLALVGLLGAGAIMVAPQQMWIGWALITFSLGGLALLGIYHVSSAVAPSAPRPKEPAKMTTADVGFYVGVASALTAVIATLKQYRMIAVIAAVIACLAVIADFVDRHWFWEESATEQPLAVDNARIDVSRMQPNVNDQKQFTVSIGLANNGKSTISEWTYVGSTATGIPGLLDRDVIDAMYIVMQRKVRVQNKSMMDINPGQNDQYVTIPNTPPFVQLDDNTLQAYKNGMFAIYVLLLVQYKDAITPSNKHLYTERCVFVTQSVIHNCDMHNHSYITN